MSHRSALYAKARLAYERGNAAEGEVDAARWELADIMFELYEEMGETQETIAEEIGCARATVSNYLAVSRRHQVTTTRPPFSEAMKAIRGERDQRVIPKAPERRAELAADLLKDKRVSDADVVRKVERKNADRRLRADMRALNRRDGIPTRTQETRDNTRSLSIAHKLYWQRWADEVARVTRIINDGAGEIERTGMGRGSGAAIRAVRALRRACDRYEQVATAAGIGRSMDADSKAIG
jgi:predicted transcriptional regulator